MRQACVFLSLSLSLALLLGAPFPSPSKLYKRQPNEVKQKSATDGGKCKLLHLKRLALEFDGERDAASRLYF